MKRKFVAVVFGVIVSMMFAAGLSPVFAATIVVNSVEDHDDGSCAPLIRGDCTLREAIRIANETPGPDIIEFDRALEAGQPILIGGATSYPLPPLLDDETIIDGLTHPDGSVTLDGSALLGASPGFTVRGSACGIMGFSVRAFPGPGVLFEGSIGSFVAQSRLSQNDVGIVVRGSSENFIGPRNTIVSNRTAGVLIRAGREAENAYGNAVFGNSIGTNGTAPMPNHGPGVQLGEASPLDVTEGLVRYNLIGGNRPNVIGANDEDGVLVGYGAGGNEITSNLIGVASDLENALPNLGDGIRLVESADNAITFNTISGNRGSGVSVHGLESSYNVLLDNCVGVAAVPVSIPAECNGVFLGNAGDGVFLGSGVANSQLDGNTIARNEGNGVNLHSQAGVDNSVFLTNSIVKNRGLGIDLGSDGLTPNDHGDRDEGPNRLQNSPVIFNTALDDTTLVVSYLVPSSPTTSRFPIAVEFFAEAPNDQFFTLGSDNYTVAAAGRLRTVSFTVSPGFGDYLSGLVLSSTGTDAGGLGNTSEFSVPFTMSNALPVELVDFRANPAENTILVEWETASETRNAGFEVTISAESSVEEYGIPVWSTIGFVEGHGTTDSRMTYSFTTPPLGADLYQIRLRQVDYDGSATFSEVVELYLGVPGDFALSEAYPNPTARSSQFSVSLRQGQHVQIDLYDAVGRSVRSIYDGYIDSNRTDTFSIDVVDLPSGMYMIRVHGQDFSESRSVFVVK